MDGTTAFQLLTVQVVGVGDNSPMFEHDVYYAEVVENAELGSIVTQLSLSDQDTFKGQGMLKIGVYLMVTSSSV